MALCSCTVSVLFNLWRPLVSHFIYSLTYRSTRQLYWMKYMKITVYSFNFANHSNCSEFSVLFCTVLYMDIITWMCIEFKSNKYFAYFNWWFRSAMFKCFSNRMLFHFIIKRNKRMKIYNTLMYWHCCLQYASPLSYACHTGSLAGK